MSGIEIERRLKSKGLDPNDLSAIVVSHEHADHIQSVGILSRRFKLPVYSSRKAQKVSSQLQRIHRPKYFECGNSFKISSLTVHPFSLPHDAEDPAGFTVINDGLKIGIATDLGTVTTVVKQHLKDCAALILEANHDPTMLVNGPYPWPLKQRIQSRTGHLSNEASKILLDEIKHDQLQFVILAHLSETNNTPQKAICAVGQVLQNYKTQLKVAAQDKCGDILYIK